jgi:hypothetical protein
MTDCGKRILGSGSPTIFDIGSPTPQSVNALLSFHEVHRGVAQVRGGSLSFSDETRSEVRADTLRLHVACVHTTDGEANALTALR